ncbi:DNA polymerase gamma [Trichophyton equinum CBS 127.97]|uniref:Mitochondrial DNA polymerase catalytic subunit n=1 Tax=Trichophyton equinum (strain ATCC MYA-4606 / CBS 127.97) TaxID=559882 RepID=F2Q096_TRIEC|nr:DNA polymerase gamma [Trichophyton equinum CBS 127.97]
MQVLSRGLHKPTVSFSLKARLIHHSIPAWKVTNRRYSKRAIQDARAREDTGAAPKRSTLALPATGRFNEIGVQQLSNIIHPQVFSNKPTSPDPKLVDLARDHLSRHDLLGKAQDGSNPIGFNLPALKGQSLDEHFHKLGMDASEPFLSDAKRYAAAHLPQQPRKWIRQSGWTKYNSDGTAQKINSPDETMLTFDTEVMWKEHPFAVMACAAGPTAWYAWISPWLLKETENTHHLVPLGDISTSRVVVGHNIGYDRARILEEYDIKQSRNFFIDTMSLHVAVNGMCSQQRPTWMKHKKNRDLRDKLMRGTESAELASMVENKMLSEEEEELWVGRSSVNSLRDVAKFHCNITIDKAQRNYFGELDREGINGQLDELLDYCAADVAITHRVYKKVFPNFLETCPHPVSFAALRHLSTVILPVNETWGEYLKSAEETYHHALDNVQKRLVELCENALKVKDKPEIYQNDPWLRQLDWSGQEIRMVKGKKKGDPPRPAARQKLPGMPKWYKDLFPTSKSDINITVRTRISPILLNLSWDGFPLVWSDKHGWTFEVPKKELERYEKQAFAACDMSEETNAALRESKEHVYFKLPHKDGPDARCASPLSKGYLQYFESGKLSSQFPLAKEALEMNASCSYWISARDRITSQMVVYKKDLEKTGLWQGAVAGLKSLKFAATLLRQFNPSMSEAETKAVAAKLYKETKGTRTTRRILSENPFLRGGTESFVFNKLEEFAEQERPRTPVLGAGITEALMRRFINKGGFMTSRINWAIQSSGVDYLHLLIISMDYLIRRFNLDARLAITVHDEIRYVVRETDKYKAAMALQVANLWTRAMFSQQMGIDDLPQSCAFFSAVDIDHVLRKEVNMDCVTPSHPNKIPHGESLDINELLSKGDEARLDPSITPSSPPVPEKYSYTPREPVMASLQNSSNMDFIKAQITSDDKELRELIKETMKKSSSSTSGSTSKSQSKRGSKSPIPPHAEPQKAVLMDVQPNLLPKSSNLTPKPSSFTIHRFGWKPRSPASV